jgi:hypothetical protein
VVVDVRPGHQLSVDDDRYVKRPVVLSAGSDDRARQLHELPLAVTRELKHDDGLRRVRIKVCMGRPDIATGQNGADSALARDS